MAYEKTVWGTGDTITAEKLNHIEDGIEGTSGVLIVTKTDDVELMQTVLNKTWQEIYDAVISGKQVFFNISSNSDDIINLGPLENIFINSEEYGVIFGSIVYNSNSADSYPVYDYGGPK